MRKQNDIKANSYNPVFNKKNKGGSEIGSSVRAGIIITKL